MCMTQKPQYKNIPSECKMPDLSDFPPLLSDLFFQEAFGNKSGLSKKTQLYRRNLIRLLDKALREYKGARKAILDQITESNRPPREMKKQGRFIYTFLFVDHIETCINAAARSYKLLDRIKTEKESPEVPRELRRLVETKSKSIESIRNAIEHIDQLIQKDKIAPDQTIMLALNEYHNGVTILSNEIKFEELAMVLRTTHEIAQYILRTKKQKS
jgi:hypothetical protein